MTTELITIENVKQYHDLISEESMYINSNNYFVIGLKINNQPLGVIVSEVMGENGIIIFYKTKQSGIMKEKEIIETLFYEVQKILANKNINYLFCYHSGLKNEILQEILKSGNWITTESQNEYMINPSKITESKTEINLPKNFTIICLDKFKSSELQALLIDINKNISIHDKIPPFEIIDTNTSYLLTFQNQLIGWFICNKGTENFLNLSRFYISMEFRETKVTIPFIKKSMQQVHRNSKYSYLLMNILGSNNKLNTIIRRGFLGEVIEQKSISKSFKKLSQ